MKYCTAKPSPTGRHGWLEGLRDAVTRCLHHNKAQRFTLPLLEAMGMKDYFDLILSATACRARSPIRCRCATLPSITKPSQGSAAGWRFPERQPGRPCRRLSWCSCLTVTTRKDVREQDCDAVIESLPNS